MSQVIVPFRPDLQGIFLERFHDKISFFSVQNRSFEEIEAIVNEEFEWATSICKINIRQRRIYRTSWVLLRDLIRSGWKYRLDSGILEMILPSKSIEFSSNEDLIRIKSNLRACMENARRERLGESQEFISRMENPGPLSQKLSITSLIADGNALAWDLEKIRQISNEEERLTALRECVKPYLQLVSENSKDNFTGHKLNDVWRYFRLTWSNPSETTPGRTLLYLIRDAARPNHPIMGIASLENCPLQITCRDDYMGWTVKAFREKTEAMTDEAALSAFKDLLIYIDNAILGIKLDELCTAQDCERPTENIIRHT